MAKHVSNSKETSVMNLNVSALNAKQKNIYKVSTIINLGFIDKFDRDEWKDHIEKLLMTTKFDYVRMLIDVEQMSGNIRAYLRKVKSVIDYILLKGLTPWITFRVSTKVSVKDTDEMRLVIEFLKDHLTESLLEKWKFEIELRSNLVSNEAVNAFKLVREVITQELPEVKIGGIGCTVLNANYINFILKHFEVDFITVKGFLESPKKGSLNNLNYEFKNFTEKLVNLVKKLGQDKPVFLSEVGIYLKKDNYLQNTLFAGAYLINQIVKLFPFIAGFGYILGSDIFESDLKVAHRIITAGPGLLTDIKLEKPSLMAVKFINEFSLVKKFYMLHDAFLAGFVDKEIYVLGTNVQYPLLTLGTNFQDAQNIKSYLPANSENINMRVKDLESGDYEIRIFKCESDMLDYWSKFDYYESLRNSDIDLLRQKDGVSVTLRVAQVKNKVLDVKLPVQANNFFIVHIRKKQRVLTE
ncbi:hypothetical protein ACLJJ6_05305 [Pediococcus siamensis]|uniref:hypothetical protein n=1 Tax=Pediococcus siamensis TaxID=381829 RepID=UPI0039A30AF1